MNSKVLQLKKIEESITYGVRTPTFRKKKKLQSLIIWE